ncbi:MAG: radical SAM protein [Candidatus Nanoarchaeia archaeon]|nr:radical SAM protein [Candidatus Nanoarchaeia archaeon]
MSLYEGISVLQFMKRPFRVLSNAYHSFIYGEKTGKPFKVKFESSTLCNLKCVMCPLTKGLTRKRGVLKFDNFKKVYDEVRFPYVNLTGLGEPLMNPDIFKIISYARKRGSLVKLDTNATLLNRENISRLIMSNPTFISVSIDGVDKKSYEKIRKGGKFEEVVENLKNLVEYRNKSGSKSQIHLFFVLQKSNIDNLINFISFGDSLGVDAVNANIAISFGKADNQENIKINKSKLDEVRKKLETIKRQVKVKLNIENVEDFLKNSGHLKEMMAEKPCFYPWYSPCITWDGYVVPCDIHCDNEVVFGNAFEEPFMKIWNNKKAREFRKQLAKKRTGICARCCVDESFISDKFKILYKLPLLNKITRKRWT